MATHNITKITEDELQIIAALWESARGKIARRIVICAGTGCIANGSARVGHDCGGRPMIASSTVPCCISVTTSSRLLMSQTVMSALS